MTFKDLNGQRTGMGTFRMTVEIADPRGQHFEAVEMLVDTGAMFTKAPRDLLERLDVPVERFYTAELADGSRVERTRGRTVIRLEGREFPTPVTFGEEGEQNLLGAIGPRRRHAGGGPALEEADTGRRPGDDQHGRVNEGAAQHALK